MRQRTHHTVTHEDGTALTLRGAVPEGATEAVLFVHGATYGGSVFDVEGASWLAACALDGRAAFALDVRGYGDSDAPPELDAPPAANEAVVGTPVAAGDAAAALAWVADRYRTVHLVGSSWGTMIAGRLLTTHDVRVDSLTLYAPVFSVDAERAAAFDPGDPAPAYRVVTREQARTRWDAQLPDGRSDIRDVGTFEAFWQGLLDTGQRVDRDGQPAIRAPNGTLVDIVASAHGEHVYDPEAITAPTLVVRGSLDPTSTRADATRLYDQLGADERLYTEVAGGSHFVHLERPRATLHTVVASFQRQFT